MNLPATQPVIAEQAKQWREWLTLQRNELKQRYLAKPNARAMLTGLSGLVDRLLGELWRAAELPANLSLVAVGGYGRGQLFPHSDVDILLLLPAEPSDDCNRCLERFVGLLWDCGLEVGHSVRTIADCLTEARRDATVQTTLLENRLVAGNPALFQELNHALRSDLDVTAFFNAKLKEQQARYARFQDTAYNLEPNIKESPGGLRDLQAILWLAQAAGCGTAWRELARQGLITVVEAAQIERRENILHHLRIRLHYAAGRREDRLLFDFQAQLANELGFGAKGTRRASEVLMHGYYRTAKFIQQMNTILLQNLAARVFDTEGATPVPLNADFQMRNGLLEACDERLYVQRPGAILETFLMLQQHPELTGIAANTLRALWRAGRKINFEFRSDPTNQALFMRLLRQPERITLVLRRMNQYGILGRYIPKFGRIVGQMQHDLYHVYTVDEHILMVVRNIRRLMVSEFSHEFPFCSQLIKTFARPEVLYLAGLFHDIAKGRGGDHSSLGTVDARRFCIRHSLPAEDTALVMWLVEQHLTMSAIAQKQDLGDPDVINAFAAKVGEVRRLDALYLLTVADIRGTSPKVWNAWKGKLLEDLYRATRRVLEGQEGSLASAIAAKQQEALRIVRHYALREEVHVKLWQQLDDGYFQRHEAQEIAWHTRQLWSRVESAQAVVRARLSPAGEGVQVMIYTPDQEALFARICGFFERMHYDIVDAKIYTTRTGYALDTFQVMDKGKKGQHYRDLLNYIEYELSQRINQQAPLEAPVKGRMSRHLKHFPIEPKATLRAAEKGGYWVLSIIAGDRPGLLSAIARILVKHQVSVRSAKIATLGERAEDVFYVTGEPLGDPNAVAALEAELVEQLRTQ